ncbi:MAG: S8 family serine peptidase, partial [Trueperaceae bacterium]|nr:S8 family serine peptidase [Trueperaceae bacterium]
MHFTISRPLRLILLGLFLLLLAACSNTAPPPTNTSFDYVASVKITADDSQSAIETMHGGKAFIFDQEAGFAMLGFSKEAAELSTLSTESNVDRFSSPVNASGFSAWAGGWSAWAGGWSSWASGWSAWAGGEPVPAPTENNALWDKVNLRQAHYLSRNYGNGVMVAVIDTGIDKNHSLFSGRLASSSLWRDYIDGDNLPLEGASNGKGYGHGTAVAGLILQVAPKATILPLRVLDSDGKGDLDDVISAIYHAVNSGAKIINVSLGSVDYSYALQQALQYAKSKEVYVVASAGNFGTLNSTTYPAQNAYWDGIHPFLIAVGSINNNNYLSSFSSYGNGLMVSVPGEKNYSAYPGNQKGYFKGTSFSAPVVSGALALAYADASSIAKAQLYEALRLSTYNSFDYWNKNDSKLSQGSIGEGILDIANLMRSISGWTEPNSRYTTSPNLFPNPGFESTLGSDWWFNNGSRSTARRSGSWGLKLNPWGSAGFTITGLKPNTTYTLIGWGKTSNAADLTQIGVHSYGGEEFNVSFGSTAYGTKSATFKTGSSNTSVDVYFSATGATAYFDDFRLIVD